jgi:hypothetical protein
MSALDEKLAIYKEAIIDLGLSISDELLANVTKSLGPSIHLKDASMVSGTEAELTTVKEKFLIGKLGLTDGKELDNAIAAVYQMMGSSNKEKHRAIFYSLLVKHFDKEDLFK